MIVVKKGFIRGTCKNIQYYFMSKKSFPFLFIKYDIRTFWTYSRLSKLYVRVGSKKITPKKNTHFFFFWGGGRVSKKYRPISYGNLLYEMGHYSLDTRYLKVQITWTKNLRKEMDLGSKNYQLRWSYIFFSKRRVCISLYPITFLVHRNIFS